MIFIYQVLRKFLFCIKIVGAVVQKGFKADPRSGFALEKFRAVKINAVENERMARELAEQRKSKAKEELWSGICGSRVCVYAVLKVVDYEENKSDAVSENSLPCAVCCRVVQCLPVPLFLL